MGEENLIEGLQRELKRNREALIIYQEIPQGAFAAMMIGQAIARAENAMSRGDTIEMIRSFKELEETKL